MIWLGVFRDEATGEVLVGLYEASTKKDAEERMVDALAPIRIGVGSCTFRTAIAKRVEVALPNGEPLQVAPPREWNDDGTAVGRLPPTIGPC
jgi:hypothetical protein